MARLIALLILLSGVPGVAPASDSAQTEQVRLKLLAEQDAVIPNTTLWLGLRFELIPHWHIYWRNPGDSGEAPRVDWQLPDGWRAGDIQWPTPQRIPVGPLVNYGYADSVTLLVPISVPPVQARDGQVKIAADVSWLVCREECIPQDAHLQISLPVAQDGERPAANSDFDASRARWPAALPGHAAYLRGESGLTLRIEATGWQKEQLASIWFAANDWGPIAPSQPQPWHFDNDVLVLNLAEGDAPLAEGASLDGLLVVTDAASGSMRGFAINAKPLDTVSAPARKPSATLFLALGLALLGGLLLNLMPCVLPVLSIKVMSLVQHAGDEHPGRHGLAFGAGVLMSLLALAGLLITLRAGGVSLGWGFQLQEPWVVIALLYLMLALGLNLSSVYSIGSGLAGVGQNLTEHTNLRGTFFTGVLAVIVASPCTAPFMGTALGFALTRPPLETLLVFSALGIGFSLPMMLLGFWPRWVSLLPAPGPWMERLRNALAFPLYATAAWLLWVLSQQVGPSALAGALAGSLMLAFGLWWLGQPLRRRALRAALAGALVCASLALLVVAGVKAPARSESSEHESWSPERVSELQRENHPVLVNFTAAWCITCKVNEQVALSTDAVRQALDERGIVYLKGDWTSRNPAISEELRRHGRSGVPLYLLYPPEKGVPEVLPQLLTEGMVLQALSRITRN